jgi:hypothetical protein
MDDVEIMIRSAALAGRYRAEAAASPGTRSGWLRMAALHSARATSIADRIANAAPGENVTGPKPKKDQGI